MNIKVFLADDHAIIRDGLSSLIGQENDIDIIGTASNGRDAVNKVKTLKPDVIVIDISMPELNGIDAAARMLKVNPKIKIIILSMHESSEYIFKALTAGASGYLLKESAGSEVIKAIRKVYSGKRYLSERIEEKILGDYLQEEGLTSKKSPLEKLSDREIDVLKLVVEGKSSKNIASDLSISPKTVETYRSRLMSKLGVKNIPSLVKFAIQHGLTETEPK